MMKRFFFLAIVLITCSLAAGAIDFEVDGLRYSVNNDNSSVTVISPAEGKTYSGDITIPKTVTNDNVTYSVTAIGSSAFEFCGQLNSVIMPNTITSIGYSAFGFSEKLTSVSLSENLIDIGNSCFCNCTGLKVANIPASVTYIGRYAFKGCSSLKEVVIPNSITEIYNYTFYGCSSLTNVTIGNSVTSIGESAFEYCSKLPRVTIPKSVTYIDLYAFGSCSNLKSLTWNAKCCETDPLWLGGTMLTEVIISNEVELISPYWMYEQSSLTSVAIPASVTSIEVNAFSNCYGLTRIDAYPDPAKVSMGENVFEGVEKDGTLHVLPQYLSAYQTANQWRDFTNIKGDLSEFVKGDVNNDKEVGIADVTALINILMSNESPIVASDYPPADVNEDGEVGIADVTSLVNILLAD